jgi:hypothetical protein
VVKRSRYNKLLCRTARPHMTFGPLPSIGFYRRGLNLNLHNLVDITDRFIARSSAVSEIPYSRGQSFCIRVPPSFPISLISPLPGYSYAHLRHAHAQPKILLLTGLLPKHAAYTLLASVTWGLAYRDLGPTARSVCMSLSGIERSFKTLCNKVPSL